MITKHYEVLVKVTTGQLESPDSKNAKEKRGRAERGEVWSGSVTDSEVSMR